MQNRSCYTARRIDDLVEREPICCRPRAEMRFARNRDRSFAIYRATRDFEIRLHSAPTGDRIASVCVI